MALVVLPAPEGKAVDTSYKLRSPAVLPSLTSLGYAGIIRYVPLPGVGASEDIDEEELQRILDSGFWSCFVQHPRFPGWEPRNCSAVADAQTAAKFARAAGYPQGVTGFVDLEGMGLDTIANEAFGYASLWCKVMVEEGYRAGVYVGYNQPMSPEELYEIPDASSYWSDAANRKVATRGTAMVQGQQFTMGAVPWDPDEVRKDQRGDTPWVASVAPNVAA